eukprot:m.18777 g.18777  ORF g.18777 m.18777 type:complete len:369 (+) comp8357_c0_seq1:2-1108(+)
MDRLILSQTFVFDGNVCVCGTNTGELLGVDVKELLDHMADADFNIDAVGDDTEEEETAGMKTANTFHKGEKAGRVLDILSLQEGSDSNGTLVAVCHPHVLSTAIISRKNNHFEYNENDATTLLHQASCCAVLDQGNSVLVGYENGALEKIDIETGKTVVSTMKGRSVSSSGRSLGRINCISPSKNFVSVCTEDYVCALVCPKTLKTIQRTTENTWSNNSSKGISAKRAKVFSTASNWLAATSVNNDGTWVSCGGTGGGYLFSPHDLSTPVTTLPSPSPSHSTITTMQYIGSNLVVGHDNGVVYNYIAGKEESRLSSPKINAVYSFASNIHFQNQRSLYQVVSFGGSNNMLGIAHAPTLANTHCVVDCL